MSSQITGVSIVCSTVCSGSDQRKHQNSVSLAFVRGIHRRPVDSPHKGAVTRKRLPFDDAIIFLFDPLTRSVLSQCRQTTLALVHLTHCGLVMSHGDICLGQHQLMYFFCLTAPSHYMNQRWLIVNYVTFIWEQFRCECPRFYSV